MLMMRGQLDQHIAVIVGGSLVPAQRAAFSAFMRDDEAFLRIGFRINGIHYSAAIGGAVAGIYVKVQTAQTVGTMVARRVF